MSQTKQIHHSIIQRCKKNDAKAQMELYNLYCKAMFLVAKRYMRDDMAAEDIMQDAFIKAFRKIETYKGEVSFGAWLKRIVINQSIDELKKKRLELVSINHETHQVLEEDDWQVEDSTTMQHIVSCIKELKEKYRVVLSLYLLEGYDHQEISQILGITEVTSRTHLLRGKKKLQETLKSLRYAEGY
ncbi:RNA polymerase sigma factor [Pseudotenacibaculum sp. MALMAid0570]|uniref:RNA polymerase sigma factor n=1 Tax=Pseudotenacibaculum sp. MALMAid0570 TaxID=3143938 RepID=UPI0032DE8425